jgi:hypothetical protein
MRTSTRQRRAARAIAAGLAALVATTCLLAVTTAPASAGQVGVTVGIAGAGSVSVVEGSIEDFGQLTCQRHDNQDHRVTTWCPRIRNAEAFEAWVWLRATPAFQPAGQWMFDRWEGCDRTRERDGFLECAVHSGAFSSDEKYPVAHFRDVVDPEVRRFEASPVVERDRTYSFLFDVTDGVTDCRVLEVTEWTRCTSGHRVTVPEGNHTFMVRATDPSGNLDIASIWVSAIETRITTGPPARTNDTTPAFTFATGAGDGFWCALDGAVWSRCGDGTEATYELPAVADGEHQLHVQSRNLGWLDSTPAVWTWTTDTVAPTTTITAVIEGDTARFGFAGDAVRYECRLDQPSGSGDWFTCHGLGITGMSDGEHALWVRGIDDVGNVESPAKVHRWTVATPTDPGPGDDPVLDPGPAPVPPVPGPRDQIPPETALTTAPQGYVLSRSATFGLASEPGAEFRCSLDGAATGCGTAVTVDGLRSGTHTFTAAAVDPAGNVDPTPVTRTWTVPATAAELRAGRGWRLRREPQAYGGRWIESSRRGATLTYAVRGAREVVLVASRGRRHGTVAVYAGKRLVRTVRLSAGKDVLGRLVSVTSFSRPWSGRLRVVVRTHGRPVRIEGLGVATG